MDSKLYSVRQYRPAYVSEYENEVFHNVEYNKITEVPFCKNFEHHDFTHFTIKLYNEEVDKNGELIISAHYSNGKHWVVGFAISNDSQERLSNGELLKDNWRYKNHTS